MSRLEKIKEMLKNHYLVHVENTENVAVAESSDNELDNFMELIEQALSKALLTAKLLKVEDQIAAAIFKYIYVNKATFTNEKDIKNIFLLHGIEEQRFDTVFNSFSVKTGVNKMKKNTETLRNQGISSVPTVIVNGKYKVETGAIKSKEQYIELVLYLLNH